MIEKKTGPGAGVSMAESGRTRADEKRRSGCFLATFAGLIAAVCVPCLGKWLRDL